MSESGMIGDKEVVMSRLDTYHSDGDITSRWTVDVVKHTSDTDKEHIEGWETDNEEEARELYSEKVREITEEAEA